MGKAAKSKDIRQSLVREAGGSFAIVHQALKETVRTSDSGEPKNDFEQVKKRIKEIVDERTGVEGHCL